MSEPTKGINPLHTILHPASIVVAGASTNFMKMGSIQAMNLIGSGFEGDILFLHPRETEIMGKPAYPDAASLPFAPDMAMLITPTAVTPQVLDELGERGVRFAVIITAGFREVGPEGKALEAELIRVADRHGIRFVGPNCIGILNTHYKLNLTVAPYFDRPGGLSLVSQSGSYVAQTLPYMRERGIRYSKAVSIGNAVSIDLVDCLEYLEYDDQTQAIALYIEGLSDARRFLRVAREVSKKKPIVALYAGGSKFGARSSLSHTGSIAGPDKLYDGLFEQAGVLRVKSVEDLFGVGHALASSPIPKGNRMAILTHSGGPATSMADRCEKLGLELPVFSEALQERIRPNIEAQASAKNPVDLTFSLDHEAFTEKIPELLFTSDEVDGVLIHGMMDTGFAAEMYGILEKNIAISREDFLATMKFNLDALMAWPEKSGKPLVASNFIRDDHAAQTFRDHDIPLYFAPEKAVSAMASLVEYGKVRERIGKLPLFENRMPKATADPYPAGLMDEWDAGRLLEGIGVPFAPRRMVRSLFEAGEAAEAVGYPVALKGLADGVAHKTEAGLVHLDLRNTEDLARAWSKITEAAPRARCLVQKMIDGERELVVGAIRHPAFGPCVMLGLGGLFTEIFDDAVFRLAPIVREEGRKMAEFLRNKKLLGEVRGLPAVDFAQLGDIVFALGRLLCEHPEIDEVDINPLIVRNDQLFAVDALIRVK